MMLVVGLVGLVRIVVDGAGGTEEDVDVGLPPVSVVRVVVGGRVRLVVLPNPVDVGVVMMVEDGGTPAVVEGARLVVGQCS